MCSRALGTVTNHVTVAVSHSHYDLGQVILPFWDFPFLRFKATVSKIPRARTSTPGSRRTIPERPGGRPGVARRPAGPTAPKCRTWPFRAEHRIAQSQPPVPPSLQSIKGSGRLGEEVGSRWPSETSPKNKPKPKHDGAVSPSAKHVPRSRFRSPACAFLPFTFRWATGSGDWVPGSPAPGPNGLPPGDSSGLGGVDAWVQLRCAGWGRTRTGEGESGGSDPLCKYYWGGGSKMTRRTDPTGRCLGERMHSVHPILKMICGHKVKKEKLP